MLDSHNVAMLALATSTAHLLLFALCAPVVLCAPAGPRRQLPVVGVSFVTEAVTIGMLVTTTVVEVTTVDPSPVVTEYPFVITPPTPPPLPAREAIPVSTLTETLTVIETVTTTLTQPPRTVTISAAPTTVTVSPTGTPAASTYWAAPTHFSNLDAFAIRNFASGYENLQIVDAVPKSAGGAVLRDGDSNSILQLLYPANSVNPGNSPVGGAQIYATPIDLANATNVTLEYSVFFPIGFMWMLGGKLPGLYGGHMTCSGGNDAKSCFSTRMMWRSGGAGELYLYAPRGRQTEALCVAPPESHCNAEYGLSISRGAFHFTPGAWTHLRQTVRLNTPGAQDGGFELAVNGLHVMRRDDIFYRDVPAGGGGGNNSPPPPQASGGLLAPLLGGLLDAFRQHFEPLETGDRPALLPRPTPFAEAPTTDDAAAAIVSAMTENETAQAQFPMLVVMTETETLTSTVTATVDLSVTMSTNVPTGPSVLQNNMKALQANAGAPARPVGFTGLFFSTFFGGSSEEYATPVDQHTWFKDFSITINT